MRIIIVTHGNQLNNSTYKNGPDPEDTAMEAKNVTSFLFENKNVFSPSQITIYGDHLFCCFSIRSTNTEWERREAGVVGEVGITTVFCFHEFSSWCHTLDKPRFPTKFLWNVLRQIAVSCILILNLFNVGLLIS